MSSSEYSDDEWVDSTDVSMSSSSSNLPVETIETVQIPKISRSVLSGIAEDLEISNLVHMDGRLYVYRCEPANKKYPSISSVKLSQWDEYMLMICLANAKDSDAWVPIRFPNFKTKNLSILRRQSHAVRLTSGGVAIDESCVFVRSGKVDTLTLKKKCCDKISGQDTAFKLGGGFASHTGNIPAQFSIVAVPFISGKLVLSQAIRTRNFHVKSKRSVDNNSRPNKRRRKTCEIAKLDTDIAEAEIALRQLQQEHAKVMHRRKMLESLYMKVKGSLTNIPDGPVKVGLEFATRKKFQSNAVTI